MSKHVIADYYQLARFDGKKFTEYKNGNAKLIRKNVLVEKAYVDKMNANWQDNGKWYEVNEHKSKQHADNLEKHKTNVANAERIKSAGAEQLANAILNIGSGAAKVLEVPAPNEQANTDEKGADEKGADEKGKSTGKK